MDSQIRQTIRTQPGTLKEGDILRDCGVDRTVARTETSPSVLSQLVIVHFEADPLRPGLPDHLAIPGHQEITAWRPRVDHSNTTTQGEP